MKYLLFLMRLKFFLINNSTCMICLRLTSLWAIISCIRNISNAVLILSLIKLYSSFINPSSKKKEKEIKTFSVLESIIHYSNMGHICKLWTSTSWKNCNFWPFLKLFNIEIKKKKRRLFNISYNSLLYFIIIWVWLIAEKVKA